MTTSQIAPPQIYILPQPFRGFFSKAVHYKGFLIMGHEDVSDVALIEAHRRISYALHKAPEVLANLLHAKAEYHIIGLKQKTSDLPQHRFRGRRKPRPGIFSFDQRVRGQGGLFSSCGEENLLPEREGLDLRDVCIHEFAHGLMDFGFDAAMRDAVKAQYLASKNHWAATWARTNSDEFFAEMSTWYCGSEGDGGYMDPYPERGPGWLAQFDPSTFELLDAIYQGRFVPQTYLPNMYVSPRLYGTATTAFELLGVSREQSIAEGDSKFAERVFAHAEKIKDISHRL